MSVIKVINGRENDAALLKQEREPGGLLLRAQQQPEAREIALHLLLEQQSPEREGAAGAAADEIGTAKAKDGTTDAKTGAG